MILLMHVDRLFLLVDMMSLIGSSAMIQIYVLRHL